MRTRDTWRTEFGISWEVPEVILRHPYLIDRSLHNDVCPRFELRTPPGDKSRDLLTYLWVDHIDEHMRELSHPRYVLTAQDIQGDFFMKTHISTDCLTDALAEVNKRREFDPSAEHRVVAQYSAEWERSKDAGTLHEDFDRLAEEWELISRALGWPEMCADDVMIKLTAKEDPRNGYAL